MLNYHDCQCKPNASFSTRLRHLTITVTASIPFDEGELVLFDWRLSQSECSKLDFCNHRDLFELRHRRQLFNRKAQGTLLYRWNCIQAEYGCADQCCTLSDRRVCSCSIISSANAPRAALVAELPDSQARRSEFSPSTIYSARGVMFRLSHADVTALPICRACDCNK